MVDMEGLRTVERLLAERIAERDNHAKAIRRLDGVIESLLVTIAELKTELGLNDAVSVDDVAACSTHDEALRLIVDRNNGLLRVREAIRLFAAAGRAGNLASAKTLVAYLRREAGDNWELVKTGEYRRVTKSPSKINQLRTA